MPHKITFELDIFHSKYNYFSFWELTIFKANYKVNYLNQMLKLVLGYKLSLPDCKC